MATINISPTTATFAAAGGQGTITLTDTASASWHGTPQSGDNWAAIREKEGNSWSDWFVFGKNGGGSATIQAASSTVLGGIKIGYTQSGKNYPVQLDAENKAFVNVPWQSGSGGSTVTVEQGTITSPTYGTLVGKITVDGTLTSLYAPKVTVTQTLSTGVEVGRIKVGSSTTILYAPDGGSGTAGVSSWAGLSGTVSLSQAVNALDESFLKLSGGTMTGTINSRAITPTTAGTITINSTTGAMTDLGNGYDLGTASLPFRAMRTKVIYLGKNENDEDVYVYYDTVNKCVRVHGAGIATDSYISAGGVQST